MNISTFEIIDILFLVVLLGFLIFFLVKNKHRLSREGILYLYKTKWGIGLINRTGDKYKKTINVLSYVSVFVGFVLMIGILYLLGSTLFQYLTNSEIVETVRAPPIAPLIPYFPVLFGLSDFFPPLYALYFVVAILIVATIHEFSHGIFARRWGIKIKTTGFAFLRFFPAIFGAFVEQDEKSMVKAKKFHQMAVLSAGVFSNIVVALISFVLLILFFNLAFTPGGVYFGSYTASPVGVLDISSIGDFSLENNSLDGILDNIDNDALIEIETHSGEKFIGTKEIISDQRDYPQMILYEDAPAVKANLRGVIQEIDGVEIKDIHDLKSELDGKSPGDSVHIHTLSGEEILEFSLVLGENPREEGAAYLGIASTMERGFIMNEVVHFMTSFRPSNLSLKGSTYYEPVLGSFSGFFYYLIWWIVLINVLVALFNMLPVGILDGGRFFYLGILSLTKSEKAAKKTYDFLGWLILLVFVLLTVRWALSFF